MDNLLQQVLVETKYLSETGQSEDYERFEQLVELRQLLTDRIAGEVELSVEHKKLVQAILQYDASIMGHMDRLKNEAASALVRLQAFKKQKNAYKHNDHMDAFMMDKRN
ncbi:flagellar protein FliT [Paenibacillus sp. R14(2021)]|uniref:flagellar protein FliT n=1 Tax=Paenibacillus sp. R14(2021) TaxID=2859228 RepID=UPI001C6128A2|nr:flagellar protein FliT [Paenibacillus sp. R14(2021)]